ncbi:hypothetical protein ELI30_00935 [Rhizobium leguminosarum]|uniref:hypothetical protein n=1 Tax=Rhizobium leguminosarum TaxID=384 RepID=UPI0010317A92|nr:hypothetical protein [Rhizobium leguminosarum]TAV46901.1 hypothetical protein ELI32_00935 [Rhizobium leguminosarum]TAV56481.1 hypothetical protein ELI31_00935 [Rhizobium leguminosarum]TAV67417.1 hypothetical protein ELI30_00935 [Rhizobium leguminosarum]
MVEENVFNALVELADKYCGPIGVGKELVISLFEETSDWAFIIQIDALNETACRDIISRLLSLDGLAPPSKDDIAAFVSGMSYQGRTSIIRLLKMTSIPTEHTVFVDVIRAVRNAFAHDIRSVGRSLMEVILEREDRSRVLKVLSYIEQFNEDQIIEMFVKDPGMLRFVILQQCLTFLYLIHINLRDREEGAKIAGEV